MRKSAVIILCLAGILIYSNTFKVPFQFDDKPSILVNPSIRNPADLRAIWEFWPTRFITYLTLSINFGLHKLDTFGYHLFNLMVHLCSGIMAWLFFLLTFSAPAMKEKDISKHAQLLALFAGLIFVAHPIQTESVTYIVQRATQLAALFYLISLNLYIKSRLSVRLNIGRFCYAGSLLAGVLAVFTKEMAVTLPFAALLYENYFLKRGQKINWRRIAPFFALLLVIPAVMLLTKSVNFMELRRAVEGQPEISPIHYFLTQLRVILTYIKLLFLPLSQNLDYDYPVTKGLFSIPTLTSVLVLALIIIAALRISSKYRLISFSVFWFFLTLLPESSIIPIKDVIFEHRLYLPMAGFSIFMAGLAYYLLGKKAVKTMVLMLILLVTWYGLLAYARNFDWQDDFTLWDDAVKKSPRKARPYNNRGWALQREGDLNRAISDFNKAIEINPSYPDAYYNRGIAYFLKQEYDKSWQDIQKARALGYRITPKFLEDLEGKLGPAQKDR